MFISGKNRESAVATSSKQSSQTLRTSVHRLKVTLGFLDIAASTLTLSPNKSAPSLDKPPFYRDESVDQILTKHRELFALLFGLFEKSAVKSLTYLVAQAQIAIFTRSPISRPSREIISRRSTEHRQ